jgi:hypothetical protein
MRWRGLLEGLAVVLTAACGLVGSPAAPTATTATTAPPTVAAIVAPTATRTAAPPTPTAATKPTSTPEPSPPNTVWVGNTDGEGVYIRNTPVMADRAKAYAEGTPLTIVGDDVEGDEQHWKHVKAPDGREGYVPSMYTVDTPP